MVRECLELEAIIQSAMHTPFERGTPKFALAKKLHTDIVYSGRNLVPGWTATVANELPPLCHVQGWVAATRQLEKDDDKTQVTYRRAHTKRMLQEDWAVTRHSCSNASQIRPQGKLAS